jgi:hypothetical protein
MQLNAIPVRSASVVPSWPFRKTFVTVEGVVAVGGLMGTVQLFTGTGTPPVSVLSPIGLSSWILPGGWLFATVAVPSVAAAWLAWRRSPYGPAAVLLASTTLALELLVQIPFLGPSVLQLIFGAIAIFMAVLAIRARREGWWPRRLFRRE